LTHLNPALSHNDPSYPLLDYCLLSWQQEIIATCRFPRNNAITDGFHTKMELLQRQAYGFRNFQNYRMRVKVLRYSLQFPCQDA
jgi:transposase